MSVRSLGSLLQGIEHRPAVADGSLVPEDLSVDSRTVSRGGAFLACQGRTQHGLRGFAQAVERGASIVLWESASGVAPPEMGEGETSPLLVEVPSLSKHAGTIASRFFDEPSRSLTIAGITGTNGKTTSAWLLAQALSAADRSCGYVGTLGAGLPTGALAEGSHTTSDAVTVQRQLAQLRAAGATCVAMEVSSHALDQHRVGGVCFAVAGFSNLSRDHLDYHGTLEAYGAAKARLFDWPGLGARVINVDDEFGFELASRHGAPGRLIAVARSHDGRARLARLDAASTAAATVTRATARGLEIDVEVHGERLELRLPLIGDFNADNALLVFGMLIALGEAPRAAARALASCTAPPGRMQAVTAPGRALAIVDYAHTPDALAKALRAARGHCDGRLMVVFGCGGDRDRGKRPLMGRLAAELADGVVITDDNPRSEAPQTIVADVLQGLTDAGRERVRVEHDRRSAIRTALAEASRKDVVLIAGKGHEAYQIYGSKRLPFSDVVVAREALAS